MNLGETFVTKKSNCCNFSVGFCDNKKLADVYKRNLF